MPRLLVALLVALLVWLLPAAAFADSFDIISYTLPNGWTQQTANGTLSLGKTDATTFVIVTVSPSRASEGSVKRDFHKAWDTAVAPTFDTSGKPQTTSRTDHGWDVLAGVSAGTLKGYPTKVLLVEMTGNGKTIGFVIATNANEMTAVEQFLGSVELAAKPAAPPPTTGARTTTFGDGWTARADTAWVEVTKGAMRVRLHYPVALDDQSRRDIPRYFWNALIAGRYRATPTFETDSSQASPVYFGTADVQGGFVALRVIVGDGTAWPIEVLAPSRRELEREFPTQDKLAAIRGANRFAITSDIAGAWTSASSAGVNMYYAATGNSAGTNSASVADDFTFDSSGRYHSEHVGASGMLGTQTLSQANHEGTYSASAWELSVKNERGTSVYDAYLEAVRGGVILHLQDKRYSAQRYALGRKH